MSPLAAWHAEAQSWLDTPSGLPEDELQAIVAARFGIGETLLRVPAGERTWCDLASAFAPPYGVQAYRMPRVEYDAVRARLGETVSVRGRTALSIGGDITFVANASLSHELDDGRIQSAPIIDWLEEFAIHSRCDSPPG